MRDRADLSIVPGADPSPGPSSNPPTVISVAAALATPDGSSVTIEGTVTAGVALLDSSGRRIVVQDASAAIEVLIPSGSTAPPVGAHLRVTGEKAHAWGAPRLKATSIASISSGATVSPAARAASLGERDEWRLVRLSGTVMSVQRLGDRWRAELRLPNGDRVPILGQAGAGIASTVIVEGRAATIVGIVKRPYPTATDRRFALLPRGRTDVAIGPGAASHASGSASDGSSATAAGSGTGGGSGSGAAAGSGDVTPDTDLATLFEHVGGDVHVGGLVTQLTSDGFLLDDGTAVGRVALHGDALILLPNLAVGEALAARGTVVQQDEALLVSVASGADLVRVGTLGEAIPIGSIAVTAAPFEGAARPATQAGAGPFDVAPAELSLLTLGGISVLSVLVTILRRRAVARRTRAVVLARLAGLAGGRRP